MQRIVLAIFTCFAVVAAGCSSSSTSVTSVPPSTAGSSKKGGEPISVVGTWTLPEPKEIPKEKGGGTVMLTIEFSADGKVKRTASINGKDEVHEGTYKHEGSKITITGKIDDMDIVDTITIQKLTDDELTIDDKKKGKGDITFIRKKK